MLAAPLAVFFHLDFPLHFFLVFARPITDALARRALKFDQIILGHWYLFYRITP